MKIMPTYHRIVVEPLEDSLERELKERESPIILPETQKEKPTQGVVREIGGGRLLDNGATAAIRLKIGDIVVFNQYAGTEIRVPIEKEELITPDDPTAKIVMKKRVVGHRTLRVMSEDDVVCVLVP